jgi:hypothetical protein
MRNIKNKIVYAPFAGVALILLVGFLISSGLIHSKGDMPEFKYACFITALTLSGVGCYLLLVKNLVNASILLSTFAAAYLFIAFEGINYLGALGEVFMNTATINMVGLAFCVVFLVNIAKKLNVLFTEE